MQTPNSWAASIGRYWFRRLVRNPIPDSVAELSALIFPIPLIRSKEDFLVRFNFNPPFERDVQFWGWKEWKKGMFVERTIICGFAQMADVSIGRLYSLEPVKGKVPEWMAFDKSNNIGCFGFLGRKTMSGVNDTIKSALGDRAA
jgi:hypothetical protein